MDTHSIIEFLLLLLIAASVIAFVTFRFKVPYTVALVFGGVLIDLFHLPVVEHIRETDDRLLTPDIIFMVFLPGLLFEAGINLHVRHLMRDLAPILLLAIPGIIVATVVTGFAVHWALGLPLIAALVFGVLIAATDPISVLALFKELGAPKRLNVLVEGESLFNDGTAVVLFQILLAGVASGDFDVVQGIGRFLMVALGGGALGVGLGYLVSLATERIDDPRVEIMLTTILAYGSFLLAEQLHVSGVIATVGAAVMIGNFGAETAMSSRTRVALWSFWEYWAFVINSLVFLMIGIEVHVFDLIGHWQAIALAIGVVLLGRVVTVYTLTPLSNIFSKPVSFVWQHVLVWGGIHGSVSLALVLTLPLDFPFRSQILAMTFGVVAFSIVLQGLTVAPLMRRLGIEMGKEDDYDKIKVRRMATTSELQELDRMHSADLISPRTFQKLRSELDAKLHQVHSRMDALHTELPERADQELQEARVHLIHAEKAAVQRALSEGLVSLHTAEEMLGQADDELDELSREDPE